jgi:D-alanyl-D-alanine carboxypeptidase/D-alanyl-D-alanine-endopeptidase (penicillin-binding protein 4)
MRLAPVSVSLARPRSLLRAATNTLVALSFLATVALPVAYATDPSADPAAEAVDAVGSAEPARIPAQIQPLQDALAQLSSDSLFSSASISVQVVDVENGQQVYQWGDDKALVPASTMKLLTAATALRTLGPAWTFPTWVMTPGKIDDEGVLDGSLYIKGQGDPTMVTERMYRMIMDLRLQGIKEIKGDVVFDEGYFADSTLIPGWDSADDLADGPTYFAPLGALSVNYNVAAIVVRPGATSGALAHADFESPTPAVVLENKLTTGSKSSRKWVKVERKVDETGKVTTFTLTGNVPLEAESDTFYKTLSDPLGNYIGVFSGILKQQGIKVRGRLVAGATPAAARVLVTERSQPMVNILADMNKHSNNFIAEQVLRTVGAERYGLPGTTAKGTQAIGEYLTQIGIGKADYMLVNGSGLSRGVSLKPSVLADVLVDMWNNPSVGPEFLTTLSVGGRDGTLRSRFREESMVGRVRGKTGTLNGVHCLSGYVRSQDDHVYAFAFLVNGIDGALSRARHAHDLLVGALAGTGGNVVDSDEGTAAQ